MADDEAVEVEAESDEPESVELVDLTDEELAAIDPRPPDDRLVVYPFLDNLEENDRQTAVVVAFRSLAARGLVEGPDAAELARAASETGNGAANRVAIGMNEALRRMLELRQGAATAVIAQRTIGAVQDFFYQYLLGDDGVLVEHVEPLGLHRFRVYEQKEAVGLLLGFLNPLDVEGTDGDPELVDAQEAASGGAPKELVARLGEAKSFGEYFVRHFDRGEERPPLHGLFTGEAGLHLMQTEYGTNEPVPVTPVSVATLRAGIERDLG